KDGVVPGVAAEDAVPLFAVKPVSGRTAVKGVVAVAAAEVVLAAGAVQGIVSGVADDVVAGAAAHQGVVADPAEDLAVFGGRVREAVVTRFAVEADLGHCRRVELGDAAQYRAG